MFDKPKDREQAKAMLMSLRSKKHNFITGLLMVNEQGRRQRAVCISKVTFKNFSSKDLEAYLVTGRWRTKAGAYDVLDEVFVESFTGSHSNICGLPTEKLVPMIKEFGVKLN